MLNFFWKINKPILAMMLPIKRINTTVWEQGNIYGDSLPTVYTKPVN